MSVTTMGGVPVEPVQPLLVTAAATCSLATMGPDGRARRPMVSVTLDVTDPDNGAESVMELGMSQETALLLLSKLTDTLVEIQVHTCDDPNCMVHSYGRHPR